jgi:cellulose biosynthesis protein BcsQ
MRLLLIETTSASQAAMARRLESIDTVDKDTLDLSIGLADEQSFLDRLTTCDVVLLGATLGERALLLARQAKTANPQLHIIMFVSHESYVAGAFRPALSQGTRKVFPESASTLDVVQELMSIHEEYRSRGSVRSSRVIAVVQAKGGVGATSACAALADVCARHQRSSILWDLDIETRDLCRSFMVEGEQPALMRELIQGTVEVSRDSIRRTLMPVSEYISILPPSDHVGTSLDLVGRTEAIHVAQSILAVARITHDTTIIDLGGRLGPAAAAILREADVVLVMLDDSLLGLSAARFFLPTLTSIVRNHESIRFLCSGVSLPHGELEQHLAQSASGPDVWSLPRIPFDSAAGRWPGSGKTLYSLGKKQTRKAFDDIALSLGVIDEPLQPARGASDRSSLPCHQSAGLATITSCLGILSPLRLFSHRIVN